MKSQEPDFYPEDSRTQTQITPDDLPGGKNRSEQERTEEENTLINPSVDSMDSRG